MKGIVLLIFIATIANCQKSSITVSNIEITWENKGKETEFVLISKLGDGVNPTNSWIGIGFGNQMVISI